MNDEFEVTLGGGSEPSEGGSEDSGSQEDRASDNPPPNYEFDYPDDVTDPPDKNGDD